MSLVEALVAIVLLGIVLLGMLPSLMQFSDVNDLNEVRGAAVQAAQQVNERTRRLDSATLPSSGSSAPETVTVGAYDFEVTLSYCLDSTLCLGDARHITTEVRLDGREIYSTETVFTRLR